MIKFLILILIIGGCLAITEWNFLQAESICKEEINRIRMIENFNLVDTEWIFRNCMIENGW